MLSKLKDADVVAGARQLARALREDLISAVYLANDADVFITRPIRDLCRDKNIPIIEAQSMATLGEACGLPVKTAVAGIKRG